MNPQNSMLFLLMLIILLWGIKADIFFMLLGTVVLLYVLTLLFFINPLEVFITTIEFVFFNPTGLLIILIPLIFYGILQLFKKRRLNYKD